MGPVDTAVTAKISGGIGLCESAWSPAPGAPPADDASIVPAAHRQAGGYTTSVAIAPDARTLKTLGQLSTIGLAFVFAIVLGFAAGVWLDRRLGTSPWLSLLGFALGLAAGILNVVRTMRSVTAAEHDGAAARPTDPPRRA